MKYLKIDENIMFDGGFAHTFNNIINMLITCYLRGLIPIIPITNLDPKHNFNKIYKTDFSEYYDYDNVTINGTKITIIRPNEINKINKINKNDIITVKPKNLNNGQLRWHEFFFIPSDIEIIVNPSYVRNSVETVQYQHIYSILNMKSRVKNWNNYTVPDFNKLKTITIDIPFNKKIIDIGNHIIKKYLTDTYTCVHSRRGDDIDILISENLGHLNKCTEQENILYKLEKNNSPKNVYLMMHPLHKEKYNKDKLIANKKFNIVFSEDINILSKLSIMDNNLLYCVENYIMEKATKKISSYRHYLCKFGNNRKIYDDYLTEVNEDEENNFSFPFLYYN